MKYVQSMSVHSSICIINCCAFKCMYYLGLYFQMYVLLMSVLWITCPINVCTMNCMSYQCLYYELYVQSMSILSFFVCLNFNNLRTLALCYLYPYNPDFLKKHLFVYKFKEFHIESKLKGNAFFSLQYLLFWRCR